MYSLLVHHLESILILQVDSPAFVLTVTKEMDTKHSRVKNLLESVRILMSVTLTTLTMFAALLKETPQPVQDECDLFRLEAITGECKVICFHPKTNKTMARMEVDELLPVIDTWVDVSNQLSQYKWVQIFENRGKMMGCSNPHPHGQVWATSFLPNLPEKADTAQRNYYQVRG